MSATPSDVSFPKIKKNLQTEVGNSGVSYPKKSEELKEIISYLEAQGFDMSGGEVSYGSPLKDYEVVNDFTDIQPTSMEIWRKKYQLRDDHQNPVEDTIEDNFKRVARALASVENEEVRDYWYEEFYSAMLLGAIPAGRILSNGGAEKYKPGTSLINCTVSDTIQDSLSSIFSKLTEAGLTLKSGAGIGYEFSTLRPRGAFVKGVGATTSGPMSFMDIYDKMCFTIASAGGRRGAQMATFDIRHPNIIDFIKAKREDGRLRQFNLSVLITDSFMEAVINDDLWPLIFPVTKTERERDSKVYSLDKENNAEYVYSDFNAETFKSEKDRYIYNKDETEILCKVYTHVKAKDLWHLIMRSTYDYAEPGFILIDEINRMNNNWFCENIRSTNPCGEQALPAYGSCLLGSINLVNFVKNPFTDDVEFDYEKYKNVVRVFTRMLDNVVELNGLVLEGQRNEILRKRRHGMGFLGLGSAMAMMRIRYGSKESQDFTDKVSSILAIEGWKTGLQLSLEKGPAPIMTEKFQLPAFQEKEGREFHIMSKYMKRIEEKDPELVKHLGTVGARFTHHTSIAPTGTISLSIGNNVSNGIEPSFSHCYYRNVIVEGKKTKQQVPVYSYEYLKMKEHLGYGEGEELDFDTLPDYMAVSDNVKPKQHVAIQKAAQYWIDSSISKTVNVPTDFPFEEFEGLYLEAYKSNLKGCTTFRFNPEAFSGVLVTEKDLEQTTYEFETLNGEKIRVKGNEKIKYEGEEHTAANLFDALKEGYYGKF